MNSGTTSARLRAKIELVLPAMQDAITRFWRSPRLDELYPEYLCTLHSTIRSTVPLMELALDRAKLLSPHDPAARGVAAYLAKHIREEAGHDEWVREDLAAIGHDPDEPLRRIPPAAVATLVGAQYYWITHYHPVCLLGHIAVLEGYPPARGFAATLAARTGYPLTGFRTIARHAGLDVRHRDELIQTLDDLPLPADLHAALGLSALHTVRSATQVIETVLASPPAPVSAATLRQHPGRSPAWKSDQPPT